MKFEAKKEKMEPILILDIIEYEDVEDCCQYDSVSNEGFSMNFVSPLKPKVYRKNDHSQYKFFILYDDKTDFEDQNEVNEKRQKEWVVDFEKIISTIKLIELVKLYRCSLENAQGTSIHRLSCKYSILLCFSHHPIIEKLELLLKFLLYFLF